MKITTNKEFADALLERFEGTTITKERGNAIVWYYEQKRYHVRVSKTEINPCDLEFHVDGTVFLLSDKQIWGITDIVDEKTLNEDDVNQGEW